jgi:hypothetical protein
MAKKAESGKRKAAGGKKGKTATAAEKTRDIRLSTHPKARQQIRLAKSWGGLIGFGLASYAAWKGGLPFVDTAVRGLLWGVVAYVAVWFCAVQVWRHLAVAEVKAAEQRFLARREEQERVARERVEADAAARKAAAAEG